MLRGQSRSLNEAAPSSENSEHEGEEAMRSRHQCPVWGVYLLLVLFPGQWECLSVHFPSEQPLHVILTQTLVLEAQIDLGMGEQVTLVTWERESLGGDSSEKVKVAEFPQKTANPRITTEKQGATLRVTDFRHEDQGVYTITVMEQGNVQSLASKIIQVYEAVHHVSVAINVSHSLLSCGEAWGTDPRFSWLHETGVVTEEVGRVSADGKVLQLFAKPCGHFTCIVSNSLGHSSATYTAEPCERQGSGTMVAVVFLVILLICGGALAFLVWRRRRTYKNRGERLREPYEDQL
ncbi:hypothetical protein AAFF_G00329230 [Aldrovandia affinis]|uniref:Ig-like domain-containing protein n=1 Tax=Aldrovandia affinis TaxID=143900 RepID=A0AAD7SLR2_9TELE|nr:hypothetical protein AAFF_G00329230 [Aldrovandia affinis]